VKKLEKSQLRKKIKNLFKLQDPKDLEVRNKSIQEHIINFEPVKKATHIAIYAALADEVQTRTIFESLIKSNKKLYLPKLNSCKKMNFFEVSSWADLEEFNHGILEPVDDTGPVTMDLLDIMLIPGRAFDKNLHRLGRGGGYYDRFLQSSNILKIGLAFEFQVLDQLVIDEHDIAMDALVTEKGIMLGNTDV
jgi:5-formyltetrahydrofolate cyclo-ligase